MTKSAYDVKCAELERLKAENAELKRQLANEPLFGDGSINIIPRRTIQDGIWFLVKENGVWVNKWIGGIDLSKHTPKCRWEVKIIQTGDENDINEWLTSEPEWVPMFMERVPKYCRYGETYPWYECGTQLNVHLKRRVCE